MLEMMLSCVDGSVYARFFRLMLIVTKTGHVSGLLARYTLPLALMNSAYWVPNQTNELYSPDSTSGCPGCGSVQSSSFTFAPAYRDGSVLPPLFLLPQAIGEAR